MDYTNITQPESPNPVFVAQDDKIGCKMAWVVQEKGGEMSVAEECASG